MNRLENKVAIITGGSSGIGEGISKLFAEEGAKVAVFARNPGTIVEEIERAGGTAMFVKVDVSDEENVKAGIEKVVEAYGKLDILVNNAGYTGADKPTHEIENAEWDAVFDVDVKGVLYCTKHTLPHMLKAGKGSIVNIASVYGAVASRGDLTIYHAAKAAVIMMTKQDAVTYGLNNIRVNAILPGTIVTPLVRKIASEMEGGYEAYDKMMCAKHPIGHTGEPLDIAYGALYLASDEAKYVTAAELYIDGGYHAW